ncbi:glycoside hydrolase family 26 protein [Streptomyces radicis]|uniref:Glycosyl hydrolase n=1 Tax=Streptomyces radicis TaxID=1750517 RepID=A0A3A9WSZ0_9ACTN|nr:glycosyl hydrolase [Streptomyces radicis]RKN10896.1 glycosyl hydrolase [Streptomyces radicis]RKN25159.1 glycosyl hydrolase [Streptomyces radicis]
MRARSPALLCAALLLALTGGPAVADADEPPPSPPAASAAPPSDVLGFLRDISGQRTVTGQHNKEPNSWPSQYTAQVHAITGVYPGLWGGDFLFRADDVAHRQTMIDQAKTEWANGSLVSLTWHVCPPTRGSSCDWDSGTGIMDDLSDAQWDELVTEGTPLNQAWKSRLDEAVPHLQQLEDAGVPVLWRPLHEMNDPWAWWGGRRGADGSSRLYRITHDYLENTKGLSNLLWVWNVKDLDAQGIPDFYPGDSYVDVVSIDMWNQDFPSGAYYDVLRSLAGDKPMALAEVGRIPSPAQLASQPEWTYFMGWSEQLTDPAYNSPDAIRNTYGDGRSLNQGELG